MPINIHRGRLGRQYHSIFNLIEETDPFDAQLYVGIDYLQLRDSFVKTMLGRILKVGLKDPNYLQHAKTIQISCIVRLILLGKVGFAKILKGFILLSELRLCFNLLL
jgi:hypothetical protein